MKGVDRETNELIAAVAKLRAEIAAKDAEILALKSQIYDQKAEIARLNRVEFPPSNNPAESGQNEANVTERVSGPNANGVCEE